ncbi:DNA adenine methylase [Nostoc sp. CHAB 5715]|nr:DNA adenine methylase [Nostoc sp. CHAB 5715]
MQNAFRSVHPASPPAAWLGGKRALANRLTAMIAEIPHGLYAEPFVGMGGVFLRRKTAPKAEVINDRNGEIINLFRILQRHYPQFMDVLKFQISSRREFERLKACNPDTLTDLERAARFLYIQKLAFGGRMRGPSFGVDYQGGGRFNLTKIAGQLEDVHERLAGVILENLDWPDFIDRYDRPETLFYLDPPYWGCEGDYGKLLFDRSQFADIAERLSRIKGRFILSINDVPEIREIFGRFELVEVSLNYTVGGGKGSAARELIIKSGVS